MEKDCFVMHGVSEVLRDRMHIQSDKFKTHVCRTCGVIAIDNKYGPTECRTCGLSGNSDIVPIQITYISKLVFQYLMSIGIVPRILVDPKNGE